MAKIQSITSVSKYDECAAKYNLHYNLGIKDQGDTTNMDRGTCVHAGLEEFLRNHTLPYEARLIYAVEAALQCENGTIPEDIRTEAAEIVRFYIPLLPPMTPVEHNGNLLLEFEFEPTFKKYGVAFQGRVDAVVRLEDGRIALLDWKVRGGAKNFYRPVTLEIDAQMPVYAAILKNAYGIHIDVAFQVQLNAELPPSLKLYKDADPSLAKSYYLQSKFTSSGRIKELQDMLIDKESQALFIKFMDQLAADTDYLAMSEIDLTNANRYLHITLRKAQIIAEDTEFLPNLNGYNCKFCKVIMQCTRIYLREPKT